MDKLQIRYHPAKKQIEFKRFSREKEIEIGQESELIKYMQDKGKFILQNQGNDFFNDIADTFNGYTDVEIWILTTKLDYEDFVQMTEYYNKSTNCKCRIHVHPGLARSNEVLYLADMDQIFDKVRSYGWDAIKILENQRRQIADISSDNADVKKL